VLPKSPEAGARWLPAFGACTVEPLAEGWLVRAAAGPVPQGATRIVIDLGQPRRWSVRVLGGAEDWVRELSPRHAELLYLLAVHRAGRSAAELARDVFGDPDRTVTVRAEMSRVRRYLGPLLDHRPYRFTETAEVRTVLPDDPRDLFPHSTAPALGRRRRPAR